MLPLHIWRADLSPWNHLAFSTFCLKVDLVCVVEMACSEDTMHELLPLAWLSSGLREGSSVGKAWCLGCRLTTRAAPEAPALQGSALPLTRPFAFSAQEAA